MMNVKLRIWMPVTLFVTGCTAFTASQLEQRYGESEPRDRVVAWPRGRLVGKYAQVS